MAVHTQPERESRVEEAGAAFRRVSVYRVDGLAASTYAVDALNAAGVPQPGDTAESGQLIVYRRTVKFVGKQATANTVIADVEVEWVSRSQFAGENFIFEGGSTLQQIETERDFFGNQLFVRHLYPANDVEFPNTIVTQGGTVSVQIPMTTLRSTGTLRTFFPDIVSRNFTGRVNYFPWAGGAPGSWLCSGVTFELRQETSIPPKFNFSFEFTHNPQTWTPLVVFIDERTGRPPAGLVANEGVKQVQWYPPLDFGLFFPLGY